ncbi:MAG: type III secretion system export apparatus subunit SctT [Candidatus Accumulibacter sp.]|jgi:type III secretion protein T|nr:type III secretion system export apparatus subunit SctT [Accumulibacter sp.]
MPELPGSFYYTQGMLLFIGYARLLTFFILVPFMGGDAVPGQLRIALAFILSLFVYPTFAALTPPESGLPFLLWLLFTLGKELLIGFILAYTASVIFWAMLSTGFLLDNQRGAGMGQTTDPSSGESTSLFGSLLNQITVYIMFSSGAFLQIVLLLLASYSICPPGIEFSQGAEQVIPFFLMGQFSRLMTIAVVFAAPIALICLLCDVSLGIINRFAPQLNVFFLSMPIKSALGLLMILLYLRTLLPLVTRELFSIDGQATAFLRAIGL